MKRAIGACVALTLAGCASLGMGPSFEELNAAMNAAFTGRHIADAEAYFGKAASVQPETPTEVEMRWHASAVSNTPITSNITTIGSVGEYRPIRYREQTTVTSYQHNPLDCTLAMTVRTRDGALGGYSFDGQWGACKQFYDRLPHP